MAEWFKRSTVNTFYMGSIPLKAWFYLIPWLAFNYFFSLAKKKNNKGKNK